MKVLYGNFKKPKFLFFTVFFVLLSVFSPIAYDNVFRLENGPSLSPKTTDAANSVEVFPLVDGGGNIFWITGSKVNELLSSGWQHLPNTPSKMVDSSSILPNGFLNPAITPTSSSGGYIADLAKAIAEFIVKSILAVIYLVLWVVYSILYGLTLLSEKILEIILNPTLIKGLGGFTTKDVVKSTAQTLANLCNMLYLFVLIYIAIKAMFGSSNTRNLLTKLVIAALLTNFGLVLAGVVIDFSQVAMYTVWDGIKGTGNAFAPGSKILDNLQNGLEVGRSSTMVSSFFDESMKFLTMPITYALTEIIKISGLIFLSLALIVTLVSVTIILMIRVILLWVLLILTPVAFLFSILPQTEKYWDLWLETLTKYAFTGPILVFFLWLALKLSASVRDKDYTDKMAGISNVPISDDYKYIFFGFVVKNINILFEMSTVIITLWAGIIIANKFGIKGAQTVDGLIGWSKRIGSGVAGGLYRGTGAGVHGLKAGAWSVSTVWEKWRDRKVVRMRAEAGELEAKGATSKAAAKRYEVSQLLEKKERSKKRREMMMKQFALTSPALLKKRFANYLKTRQEEYQGDMEKAMTSFTSILVNKGQRQKLAEINSRESLYDLQNAIQDQVRKYRKTDSSEEKDKIKTNVNNIIKEISERTSKDPAEQKKIKDELDKNIFDATGEIKPDASLPVARISTLIKDVSTGTNIDILKKAGDQARADALNTLRTEKDIEAEAKKQKEFAEKIREQDKEGKFNADLAIRQVLRKTASIPEQKAIIEHLATSSGNFNKFIKGINKELGNTAEPNDVTKALDYLKQNFSERDMVNFVKIAERDAGKTNNLTQMGWVTFDPILNKARKTDTVEREDILKGITSNWNIPKKIADVSPTVFEAYRDTGKLKDESAAKVLIRDTDFKHAINNVQVMNEVLKKTRDNTKTALKENKTKLGTFAKQKPEFQQFVNALEQGQPPQQTGTPPSAPNIIAPPGYIAGSYHNSRGPSTKFP